MCFVVSFHKLIFFNSLLNNLAAWLHANPDILPNYFFNLNNLPALGLPSFKPTSVTALEKPTNLWAMKKGNIKMHVICVFILNNISIHPAQPLLPGSERHCRDKTSQH